MVQGDLRAGRSKKGPLVHQLALADAFQIYCKGAGWVQACSVAPSGRASEGPLQLPSQPRPETERLGRLNWCCCESSHVSQPLR